MERDRSRRRPFEPERPREKLRRSMIAFDRFPCVSSRPFPSSTFGPPRATWLARGLETGHRGNARFGSPRLLIDANFSDYPRGEPPAPPSRVLLAKKRRRNSIRSGTTDPRDRVIKIIKIIRSSLSLSRSIDGSKAHGCNTLAMIYFFPKEKCSRAGAIDASINYRASTILYECA